MRALTGCSGLVVAAAGTAAAAPAAYLAVLAVAASRHRPAPAPVGGPPPRILVLVPAHDEAHFVARCVGSLLAQSYPADRYEVVVVADNCTDDTAAVAAAAGARVLVRDVPDVRGKGQALAWAIDRVLAGDQPPDGVAVVDADTVADPAFLATLARPLAAGAGAVQGESLLESDGSPAGDLRAAAFLLVNRVRPAGRAVLGFPCNLAGNGMLLSRRTLTARPWRAFSATEDLEYGLDLRLAGVDTVFARGALLFSPVITDAAAAERQRLRWEGGKLHLARRLAPTLVAAAMRERRPALLEAALDLVVPPLGLLAGAVAAGTVAAGALVLTGAAGAWALVPWAGACAGLTTYVVVGFAVAGAPPAAYRAMTLAPALVARKVLRVARLARFRADTWERGARPGEQAPA